MSFIPLHLLVRSLPLHQVSLCPGRPSASRASRPAPREAPQPSGQVPSLLQSACMSSPVCVSGSQCHGAAIWVQQDSGLPVLARKFHLKEEAGLTPELGECPAVQWTVQWTIQAGCGWTRVQGACGPKRVRDLLGAVSVGTAPRRNRHRDPNGDPMLCTVTGVAETWKGPGVDTPGSPRGWFRPHWRGATGVSG